ncbi:MAG: hypothetical protein IPJ84_07945 [Bdellovibrionales bacterium]|nr:hypothetical protein [Bdellovibrionales bacterium]
MKTTAYLLAPVLLTGLVACSNSDSSPGAGAAQAVNPSSHKVEQCPQMNGRFRKNDDAAVSKVIKTSQHDDGITIDDTNVQWTINGKKQDVRDQAGASYIGICADQKLVIDLFMNNQPLGKMTYSLSNGRDLTIEMLAIDPKLAGQNSTEKWVLDKPSTAALAAAPSDKKQLVRFEGQNAERILAAMISSDTQVRRTNSERIWTSDSLSCRYNTDAQLGHCTMGLAKSSGASVKMESDGEMIDLMKALMELKVMNCDDNVCAGIASRAECGHSIDANGTPTGPTFCDLTR